MTQRGKGRSWWVVLGVVFLVIAAGWVVRMVGEWRLAAARTTFEAAVGSLSLSDYGLPDLADTDNCAVWLRRAAEGLAVSAPETDSLSTAVEGTLESWSGQDLEAARQQVEANQAVFAELEKCLGLEASSFGFQYEEGFDAAVPPLLDLYRLSRMVATDLRVALVDSDLERVAKDLEILEQLSAALARESFLLSALLHLGVERLRVGAVRDVVETDGVDPALLVRLQRGLAIPDSAAAVRRSVAGEAAAVLDAVENRDPVEETSGSLARYLPLLFGASQLASLLDFYSEVAAAIDRPWIETLEDRRSESQESTWSAHPFLAPNTFDAVDKLKAIELSRILAAQALVLRLESLENGDLPDGISSAPQDPYAMGSLRYELSLDGGASLSAPEAIELWQTEHPEATQMQRPVFAWQLPAPLP